MSESSSTSRSDEETEELLDRMLTRFALCDDSKLQPLLSKLLPLTLSSLSSSSTSLRNKVLEILSHVNKSVKHRLEIELPLQELWKLYTNESSTPMVKNFCVIYIEMAFERVNGKEKENMAPVLLTNISKLPQQHQDIFLRIATQVIGECHANKIDDEVAAKYRLANGSKDEVLFIDFCLQLMLYQQPSQGAGCPPGLSIVQTNRITGKHPLKSDILVPRKLGVLNVLEAIELAPELVYPIYLVASTDCQETVIKRGEELLRKKASTANLDDSNLISKLFLLFNGTTGAENVTSESRVYPGSVTLRIKLMSIFCRSIKAANSFPATLQCIFGCIFGTGTTSRLKQLGMEFTVWVFKHAQTDQLKLMGPVILSGILKLLDGHLNSESDAISRDTKTFSFQAIGLIAQRLPHLFRDKIDMAVRLFNSLKMEAQSLRLVIQEATSSLVAAYKGAPPTVLVDLEALLLNNAQVEQSEVRLCAVRWATSLFGMQHCPSRFVCMLGVSDSSLDIREIAHQGLFPLRDDSRSGSCDVKYPKFGEMLDYIVKQQPEIFVSSETRVQKLIFSSETYVAMIQFLLKCFESDMLENNLEKSPELLSSVETMCLLLEHAVAYEGSAELHSTSLKSLITIGSYLPEMMASRIATRISWLKQLLNHLDSDTRETAARLLGVACSALSASASSDLIIDLLSLESKEKILRFEVQHGALCAIGYVTAECMSRMPTIPDALFQNVLRCLTGIVNSETATLASVAMQALGHIGLRAQLPSISDDSRAEITINPVCKTAVDILVVVREKLSKLLSGDDIKATQKIVISLGYICVNETSASQLNIALDLIFGLCRSKVEEILFAAGEALSFMWGSVPVTADLILKTNYLSLSTTSNFLLGNVNLSLPNYKSNWQHQFNESYHASARDAIIKKLFDVLLYSSRKEERCTGTVWLLSLTMYCGQDPMIQRMLPDVQEAFTHLLGEQNELTQELASQGMSIVYELGNESMKKNLVESLVGTLTGSGKRKRAIKLVEDSEVFQAGTMGESLNGGKLSTYKELCNLANEMGQPDLIYKFMDLANHHASLNSKRGAAFGFSKIAKQAGDALQPHLRLLIPRLVRYQYDPDKNVQDAMSHIWKSLVADPKMTIDQNLDIIIEDLLIQCGSRLWRSREASCTALADIIQGRKFDQIGRHLKKIWVAAFRAMDDIKETVRTAGDKLCRAATSLTIRLCDISLTEISNAAKAMEIVLPFLLSEGILSKVDAIRKVSIGVVMKLAKGAGTALRPHLSDLVCCMLESLSSLEDQGLNYVELHAANVGIQTERLEDLRISMAKGSPMWETLDLCINVINTESLNLLVPRLGQLVRSGVGLNTRVGVASFISLLVQKVGADIKPFTNMLLRLLFPVVKEERSGVSKRAFANACAMVLKHSTLAQIEKLIDDTAALHTGDKNSQVSCAVLLKSFFSTAGDVVSGFHAAIFPVIFISRFNEDKSVSSIFEELWEDNTTGERLTAQLYLDEIVSLICECLISSSWSQKRMAAQAICQLSEVLGESLSSHFHILLESLMQEIPGRLWEGKDALLDALGAISKSCHKAISSENSDTPNAILTLVSSACSKKVKKYRESALSSLDQVIKAFNLPHFFNIVFPLLYGMCNTSAGNNTTLVSMANEDAKAGSDAVEETSAPREKIITCITSCIHVGHVNDILEQKMNLMDILLSSLSHGFQWTVKLSAFSLIKELCSKLQNNLDDIDSSTSQHGIVKSFIEELFQALSPKILECMITIKIAQVHLNASECLLEMTKLTKYLIPLPSIIGTLKADIVNQIGVEKTEEAKSYLKRCIEIIESSE